MKKLLLTGFEPFLTYPINPTQEVIKALDGRTIGEYTIVTKSLPVDFVESEKQILQTIQDVNPDAVISLGLAAGRFKITPERIAINVKDGAPDNNGVKLQDVSIEEQGNDAYLTTLPIRGMVNRLKEANYPAEISNSAGTYLCNNVMYAVLHHWSKGEKLAGFIHIPASHELAVLEGKIPSWSQVDLNRSIEICIETLSN
jgi:pyroglutamyl-peptidase